MEEPIRFYDCSPDATLADLVNLYPADFSISGDGSKVWWFDCALADIDDDINAVYYPPGTAVKDIRCAYDNNNVSAAMYFYLIQK